MNTALTTTTIDIHSFTYGFTQGPSAQTPQTFGLPINPHPHFYIETPIPIHNNINISLVAEDGTIIGHGLERIHENLEVGKTAAGTLLKFTSLKISALSKILVSKLLKNKEIKDLETICGKTNDEGIQSLVKPIFDAFKAQQADTNTSNLELAREETIREVKKILCERLKDKSTDFVFKLSLNDIDRTDLTDFSAKLQGRFKLRASLEIVNLISETSLFKIT